MYAIIFTGGKQYRVQVGDLVRVEKLSKNLGDEFELTDVLMIGGEDTFIGQPLVEDAKVNVVVTRQAKAPKVIVFKKKRRQGYRRMHGHRQIYTELFIKSITTPNGSVSTADADAPVVDVKAKAEKKAQERRESKKTKREKKEDVKATSSTKKAATKKKAVKKKTKKKAAAKKKTAKKKTKAKKTAAKKKTTAKKATKKKS